MNSVAELKARANFGMADCQPCRMACKGTEWLAQFEFSDADD